MKYLLAADTGGTFTDVVVHDSVSGRTEFGKRLTNYENLVAGVTEGLQDTHATLDDAQLLKHGTTHVINAFIQRTGSVTALITTRGFRDILEIARGNRAVPFDLGYRRHAPLVPRSLRLEVTERIDAKGNVVEPLRLDDVDAVVPALRAAGVQAIAISFLNAYLNPAHEQAAKERLAGALPDVFVTTGTELSREWAEYERTSTAAANAYVGARMRGYIASFDEDIRARGFRGAFYMMGSNGGVMSIGQTVAQPVALVESGPIGGCIGASAYAKRLGIAKMIALDVGGTTAKCALVENGEFDVQATYYIGGYERGFPIRTPVLDIVEVGAGGGSIAWLDGSSRLQLGPRSAGSEPGPIAFGRGGTEPTVTDANAVLGRIGSDSFLDGKLTLDIAAARAAITTKLAEPLGFHGEGGSDRVAQGILDLATVIMSSAIKEISVERGRDARDYCLFAFGGGGPLFATDLARKLHIPRVIIPPQPGNFSSLGMLLADARCDVSRSLIRPVTDQALGEVRTLFGGLEDEARTAMSGDFDTSKISFSHEADMRYHGQKHTVRVRLADVSSASEILKAFEALYRIRFGHLNESSPVEFIALHVAGFVPTPRPDLKEVAATATAAGTPQPRTRRSLYMAATASRLEAPVYRRADLPAGFTLTGPAIIEEYSSTTVLSPDDRLVVGGLGELDVTVGSMNEGLVS